MLAIHRIRRIRARHYPESHCVELDFQSGLEHVTLELYFDNHMLAEIFFTGVPEVGEQSADDLAKPTTDYPLSATEERVAQESTTLAELHADDAYETTTEANALAKTKGKGS